MNQIPDVVASKLSSKRLASLESKQMQNIVETSGKLEFKEFELEITRAFTLMNEINERIEATYQQLTP